MENVTPEGGDIKVYKSDTATTAMRGTVAVGTGNVVKLFDSKGNVVDSLTVVILGDVSGDGKINATDLISLVAYIGGSREYTEAQTIAANLQQPVRPTINAQDLAFLKGAMDGSKTIVQK